MCGSVNETFHLVLELGAAHVIHVAVVVVQILLQGGAAAL